eukprot:g21495.t1
MFLFHDQDFFAKNLSASDGGADGSNVVRIRVSSNMSIGQPFCGEYQEPQALWRASCFNMNGWNGETQSLKCNDRAVYKKLGLPANSQAVYLLYNDASQWDTSSAKPAFTPHADGRPDGWAFVGDAAMEPTAIAHTFSIWDGSDWVPDTTLKLLGPGQSAPVEEPAGVVKQPSGLQDIEQEEVVAAAPVVAAQSTLPEEVKDLSMIHWKSHWKASQRCLIDWPEGPAGSLHFLLWERPFDAHIELHVGSIDEDPDEQGIAHMMEHVCFLGSRKRERLIGTGSRSNALTDFQHTIYHVHAPVKLEDGRSMYLPCLEALYEIAFAPEMLPHRIEKERKAVLAEMQQVNDMEYRIETWTLSGLHETCKLGSQFPIGKEEQIKAWQQKDHDISFEPGQDLRNFHEKWYYPGNATLYVVGDIDETEMVDGIKKVFELANARHKPSPDSAIMEPIWGEASADARSLFRRKIARERPEQLHNFSLPMIGTDDIFTGAAAFDPKNGGKPWHGPLRIFRNELLEGLQLNFYAKTPVRPLRTYEDIRNLVAVRILVGVLQFRIVSRYSSNHAPVQIDHSDSFREGCAVTSITVNADPRDWRNALACVIQEIRAICDYGITESEMKRYMDAMLKDPIWRPDVFDHVIMHPEQSYAAFKEVAPTVTMEQVHATAKWMLGFIGYYGLAAAPPITAIVVCTPTQHSGKWVPFSITEQEVIELLLSVPDKTREEALNQVDVPENLFKAGEKLEKILPPSPVDAMTAWRAASRKVDDVTGIVQIMLPNGARVNYACTPNESQGSLRILVPGGRSSDEDDELASAMVGIRTISESGAVSDFSREQIELFAVSNLMSKKRLTLLSGLTAVLELLHLLFQETAAREPRWEVPAFVRAQQAYKAQAYAVQKSLALGSVVAASDEEESDVSLSAPTRILGDWGPRQVNFNKDMENAKEPQEHEHISETQRLKLQLKKAKEQNAQAELLRALNKAGDGLNKGIEAKEFHSGGIDDQRVTEARQRLLQREKEEATARMRERQRLREEKKAAEEANKMQQLKQAEEREQSRQARQIEEQRLREELAEKKKAARELKEAREKKRLEEEEGAKAEEQRLREEIAEEQRKAQEFKEAEEKRRLEEEEEEAAAEEQRLREEIAEEQRKAQEVKEAEEKRRLEEEEEAAAEEQRLREEIAEEERKAKELEEADAERRLEKGEEDTKARLKELIAKEEQEAKELKEAEEKRRLEEKAKAEEQRLREEIAEKKKKARELKEAKEKKRLEEEQRAKAEEQRLREEIAEEQRKAQELKKADEERRLEEEELLMIWRKPGCQYSEHHGSPHANDVLRSSRLRSPGGRLE